MYSSYTAASLARKHDLAEKQGSPVAPGRKQYAELEAASNLATLGDTEQIVFDSGSGKLLFKLPRQGVSLIVLGGLLVLILIAQNAVFTLFWLWASVVVFSGATRLPLKILILLSVVVLVTPAHMLIMKWYLPGEVGWIETLNAYAFAIGFSIYTWLALALAWFVGIELQRERAKSGS